MTTPPDTVVVPQTTFVVADTTLLDAPYRVIIENDDVTPMDFVVYVLTAIFALGFQHAMEVMLVAHEHGEALVTILPYQEASAKVYQAHELAQANGYPLRFYLEPAAST
jgi:ATP-dependent Clp protease adaptor protein ClpS